jgi:hypothetical protein
MTLEVSGKPVVTGLDSIRPRSGGVAADEPPRLDGENRMAVISTPATPTLTRMSFFMMLSS